VGLGSGWGRSGDDVGIATAGDCGEVLALVVDPDVDATPRSALEARYVLDEIGRRKQPNLA
jgi:hypothetical protein